MTIREQRIVGWLVSALVLLILLEFLGIEEPGYFVAVLCVGWIWFLERVIPQIHFKIEMIASDLIYAAALIVGSHFFLRWLYRSTANRRWRFRWTISGIAVFVLMFVAGLSAIGITDHVGKLIASTQPLFKPNRDRERANRARCASNLHQIGLGILLYQRDNAQQYPPDLSYLLRDEQMTAPVFVCPASNDEAADIPTTQQAKNLLTPHHCSYIYLGKGLADPVPADRVVALEPLENHDGEGINVLYGDGHAEWLEHDAAIALLKKVGVTTQPSTLPAAK